MRGYNVWRPLFMILIALFTNGLVTNLCMVFGMSRTAAGNVGFVAMMIAAVIVYLRYTKNQRKRK
ncbi:hypothetical protein ACFQ3W_03570 [Paenibacillus puldeungensis]|uniref:Uncharacterized protein n=1 Tax=Paenibacillus puldeungensis TaxID=696536 RepID=A0ABW3RSC1_9BACL